MDLKTEYEFIKELWKYIKKHRRYTKDAWDEGNALLIKYKEVPYAVEMVKAYLDTI